MEFEFAALGPTRLGTNPKSHRETSVLPRLGVGWGMDQGGVHFKAEAPRVPDQPCLSGLGEGEGGRKPLLLQRRECQGNPVRTMQAEGSAQSDKQQLVEESQALLSPFSDRHNYPLIAESFQTSDA